MRYTASRLLGMDPISADRLLGALSNILGVFVVIKFGPRRICYACLLAGFSECPFIPLLFPLATLPPVFALLVFALFENIESKGSTSKTSSGVLLSLTAGFSDVRLLGLVSLGMDGNTAKLFRHFCLGRGCSSAVLEGICSPFSGTGIYPR